jgi:hypothetical protein
MVLMGSADRRSAVAGLKRPTPRVQKLMDVNIFCIVEKRARFRGFLGHEAPEQFALRQVPERLQGSENLTSTPLNAT